MQQPTGYQVPQVEIQIHFGRSDPGREKRPHHCFDDRRLRVLLNGRQRLESLVLDRAAETGNAAQPCLPGRTQAVVSRLQHVMLPLDQITAHVQTRRGGDVAGLPEIAHNQARQQSQAERMVTVGCAGRLNLGARAAHALGAKEFHGIGRMHLPEFLLATALQQAAAFGFQHLRAKPGCQENPGSEIRLRGDVAEKEFRDRRDTVAVIAVGGRTLNHRFGIITLIGRVQAAKGAELALETVKHEQRARRNEYPQERPHSILGGQFMGIKFPLAEVSK